MLTCVSADPNATMEKLSMPTPTWGDWVRQRLRDRIPTMEQQELVQWVRQHHPDVGLSESYLSALLNNERTPKGNLKQPSRAKAIAVAEAINTDPTHLQEDIDASLLMAGYSPKRPAVVVIEDGRIAISRPNGPFTEVSADVDMKTLFAMMHRMDASLQEIKSRLPPQEDENPEEE